MTLHVDSGAWPARTFAVANGADAIATFMNHPASLGFSADKWTPVVAVLLDQARLRLAREQAEKRLV